MNHDFTFQAFAKINRNTDKQAATDERLGTCTVWLSGLYHHGAPSTPPWVAWHDGHRLSVVAACRLGWPLPRQRNGILFAAHGRHHSWNGLPPRLVRGHLPLVTWEMVRGHRLPFVTWRGHLHLVTCRLERGCRGNSRSGRGLAHWQRLGGTVLDGPGGGGCFGLWTGGDLHIVVGVFAWGAAADGDLCNKQTTALGLPESRDIIFCWTFSDYSFHSNNNNKNIRKRRMTKLMNENKTMKRFFSFF